MAITAMDHFTVTTDRLSQSIAFYTALGLQVGPRPDFSVGGAWLYAGDRAILHLVEAASERMPAVRRGAIDHIAFRGDGLIAVSDWLEARGIGRTLLRTPRPFTQWQLFFLDPNGAEVEIDFDADETPPEDWKSFGPRGG